MGVRRPSRHAARARPARPQASYSPLSFLNAYSFLRDFDQALATKGDARLMLLEASNVVEIDFTAAEILGAAIRNAHDDGMDFAIARLVSVRAQAALARFGVLAALGPGHLFQSVDEAIRVLGPAPAAVAAPSRPAAHLPPP
jgi:MFS superfamily sulfate permease-like transporter